MEELNEIDLKILYYVYYSGSAFIKKLAARLNEDMQTVSSSVKKLRGSGYLERVTGTIIDYRIDRRNKVTKHRNHTYYDLTRKGRLFMRQFHDHLEVNLKPPYRQV